jgi:hypothetical protein
MSFITITITIIAYDSIVSCIMHKNKKATGMDAVCYTVDTANTSTVPSVEVLR